MSDEEQRVAGTAVQVYIFNQTYNLRAGSDEEYVRHVARVVDERMRQISSLAPNHDALKIAVLAALNLADELERAREPGALEEEEEQPPLPPDETEQPPREAAVANGSWFDDIFDAGFKGERGSGSLSTGVTERLHTRRPVRRTPITIEPDEK